MKLSNLKITLLENTPFLKEDGTFNLKKAMDFSGKIGGICYNEKGLIASLEEDEDVTEKRVNRTTLGEHQSIFEHVNITMYLKDSSKMLDMVLNNEGQYSTSERSLRYTTIKEDSCNLTNREIFLYNKWYNIFIDLITAQYGEVLKPFKIKTLAKENARYMTSTFVNTEMVHTVPLAQLNRITAYMKKYIEKENKDDFEERLSQDFKMFINECDQLHLLDDRLQSNRKERSLKIFGKDLNNIPEEFGVTYSTNYKGSFAEYAQKERHRIEKSSIERDPLNGFFVPPILQCYPNLIEEWLYDIISVIEEVPQGELVTIHEEGTFDTFISKLKERDCSAAQLEIFRQVEETKKKYYEALKEKNHPYVKKLEPYIGKRRCKYPDYECKEPCGFREGIIGSRRI